MYALGISKTTSGLPIRQPSGNFLAGGRSSVVAPCAGRLSIQPAACRVPRSTDVRSLLNLPCFGSACQGGMRRSAPPRGSSRTSPRRPRRSAAASARPGRDDGTPGSSSAGCGATCLAKVIVPSFFGLTHASNDATLDLGTATRTGLAGQHLVEGIGQLRRRRCLATVAGAELIVDPAPIEDLAGRSRRNASGVRSARELIGHDVAGVLEDGEGNLVLLACSATRSGVS